MSGPRRWLGGALVGFCLCGPLATGAVAQDATPTEPPIGQVIAPAEPAELPSNERAVLQKVKLLENLLASTSLANVAEIGDDEAYALIEDAWRLKGSADAAIERGLILQAEAAIDQALRKVAGATASISGAGRGREFLQFREEYNASKEVLDAFRAKADQAIEDGILPAQGVMDLQEIDKLMERAGRLLEEGKFKTARNLVGRAERLTTNSSFDALDQLISDKDAAKDFEPALSANHRHEQLLGMLTDGRILDDRLRKRIEKAKADALESREKAQGLAGREQWREALAEINQSTDRFKEVIKSIGPILPGE